ncbi:ATM interactor [Chiloscyllium plagiosum]|uniref:ATM interactor n=1 Tax=Chiloscyllium plagiosum TaxID=36176 RepID=UPI001CB8415C|nr:ATM interactor [Chiloscyllium plagiosum]
MAARVVGGRENGQPPLPPPGNGRGPGKLTPPPPQVVIAAVGGQASSCQMIRPSVSELSREVRTNILCTVKGCGKILPNPPALSMHLVKSHRVQDCSINPTIKKDLKSSVQKLYCCPIEGCPRGPNRPFTQFSLVKQHFMKIHAEKKHKCDKCSNSYGTEWDLKRHAEDCGRIFQCTCGCPYASRPALLSHIYRTGHEIPAEHRDPPRKKRKNEWPNQNCLNQVAKVKQEIQIVQDPTEMNKRTCIKNSCGDDCIKQPPAKQIQKLLLPKPRVALVKLPVMHLTHLPVILSSGTSVDNSVKSIVVAVDDQGSILSTMHILPPSVETVTPSMEVKGLSFKGGLPTSKVTSVMMVEPVSTAVQINMDSGFVNNQAFPSLGDIGSKNKFNSTNVQTEVSHLAQNTAPESLATCYSTENTVSACAQTDLSISAQVLLPVSVQTQTFEPDMKITTSISAQTDSFGQTCFPLFGVSRKTQTSLVNSAHDESSAVQALINTSNHEDIFDHSLVSSYSVCTQTQTNFPLDAVGMNQKLSHDDLLQSSKSAVEFHINSTLLQQNPMTDNQTQTINLFNDLENILSESIANHSLENRGLLSDASESMTSSQAHSTGIDFDIEFLSASNIQTQTEENEFGTLQTESALESLDIETQTDFFFSDHPAQAYNGRGQSTYLGLEMFDTQTQTDFNFLIDSSTHLPLDSILKQSSLSLSAESSGTKTQTDDVCYRNNLNCASESQVQLNCTETQTTFESLSSLFFTSNETQTVMDDFLLADTAWNTMESHFSSVETQTCDEIFSLFRNTDKNSD